MKRIIKILVLVVILAFAMQCYTFSEVEVLTGEVTPEVDDTRETMPTLIDDELQAQALEQQMVASPTQAFLKVNTNSYGAPNPQTGVLQETVAINTNVWVVEKSWCSAVGKYYYYAGYSYNNKNHRGYFSEDNVYLTATQRLLPANVSNESKPAAMKQHTSLAGTVYDGPGTSYAQTGSIGQVTISLIRTEGNFNFIEYAVSGKKQRGFLDYTKIKNIWAALSAQNQNKLDGYSFFVQNKRTSKYLTVHAWSTANNESISQAEFHGDTNQVFRFSYNSGDSSFSIQPLNTYSGIDPNVTQRRLNVSPNSDGSHPDRRIRNTTNSTSNTQRFWVVKATSESYVYRLVPVSSYGTMTVTDRFAQLADSYVRQYYTDEANTQRDLWSICPFHITENADPDVNIDYNRVRSSDYQLQYWEEPNEDYEYYNVGGDCTNYVSQCLGDSNAGALPMIDGDGLFPDTQSISNWFYHNLPLNNVLVSRTWTSASWFASHWGVSSDGGGNYDGNMRSYQCIEFTNDKTACKFKNALCEMVSEGDIIQQKTIYLDEVYSAHQFFKSHHSMAVMISGSDDLDLTQHTTNKTQTLSEYFERYVDEGERLVIYAIAPPVIENRR